MSIIVGSARIDERGKAQAGSLEIRQAEKWQRSPIICMSWAGTAIDLSASVWQRFGRSYAAGMPEQQYRLLPGAQDERGDKPAEV